MGRSSVRHGVRRHPAAYLATLAVALLVGSTSAACIIGGDDEAWCQSYDACKTEVGLTVEVCDDGSYRFNDGVTLHDADEAFFKCYCTHEDTSCVDGRTATLCQDPTYNSIESTLEDTATFSDGSSARYNQGFADCFGYNTCDYIICDSRDGRYLMGCLAGDTEYTVTWDGHVFEDNEDGADRYCDGESLTEAMKKCEFSLGSCAELNQDDCLQSNACTWDSISDPEICEEYTLSYMGCENHDNVLDCNPDPACTWR